MSFLQNLIRSGGTQAIQTVIKEIAAKAPETSSLAQLATMEDDLDAAGRMVTHLQTELANEEREFDTINRQYSKLLAAADVLQHEIDDPTTPEADRVSKQQSLDKLLTKIEGIVPDLDRERQDVETTRALLSEAEQSYQEKVQELRDAKGNLERAKHDMAQAKLQEERAKRREENAQAVAGLKPRGSNSLNVAVDAMHQVATESRERAAASEMKAKALTVGKEAIDDPNVAAALAKVSGHDGSRSLADRLAALKR